MARNKKALSDEVRNEILTVYRTGQYSKNQIAKQFNLSHTTINNICKGKLQDLKKDVSTHIQSKISVLEKTTEKEMQKVESIIDKRLQDEITATKYAKYVIGRAMNKLKEASDDELTFQDLISVQRQVQQYKETTIGKEQAQTNIQINNKEEHKSIVILPSNNREQADEN